MVISRFQATIHRLAVAQYEKWGGLYLIIMELVILDSARKRGLSGKSILSCPLRPQNDIIVENYKELVKAAARS
ncbi:MAG: hypothetical protein FWE09_09765 [Treponema sp.]|nr:hypothetical protein [Treponema sp.]